MSETPVKIDNPDELEQAGRALILASTLFLIALRRAHHEEQPEAAVRYSALLREGQAGLRLEIGMAPSIEAGVVRDGTFYPFFEWKSAMNNNAAIN
jgi:hypothetical protein